MMEKIIKIKSTENVEIPPFTKSFVALPGFRYDVRDSDGRSLYQFLAGTLMTPRTIPLCRDASTIFVANVSAANSEIDLVFNIEEK